MGKPKISVVMPVYNGGKYLKQSLKSILNQTYKNFELIVVNDGSTDSTAKILTTINDKRLKIIHNIYNVGVAKSLNRGLKIAKGDYIARCDSDDINFKKRFKIQIDFLDKHLSYALVGSNAMLIDEKGKKIKKTSLPATDSQIRKKILFRNPILHPAVVYRKKLMNKTINYREMFNGAEDYDLWFRLLKIGKAYNFKDSLIKHRIHKDIVTKKFHLKIELLALFVRLNNFSFLKYIL